MNVRALSLIVTHMQRVKLIQTDSYYEDDHNAILPQPIDPY